MHGSLGGGGVGVECKRGGCVCVCEDEISGCYECREMYAKFQP